MASQVKKILQEYACQIKAIYGSHLKNIILYGSYARGDYNAASDIDLMILVDLSEAEIKKYNDVLAQATFDLNLEYEVLLMPVVKNIDHFIAWQEVLPFYKNVNREGVPLYAA